MELNKIYNEDCLKGMKRIPDESIDCIIVDPPYGTVKGMKLQGQKGDPYSWDTVIDMEAMFEEYFRILKPKGKVFMFSQNNFTQMIRSLSSTYIEYLYPMIWKKNHYANFLSINKAPVQIFEDISVFEKIYGMMPKSRAYADKVIKYIGQSSNEINKQLGHRKTEHFFSTKSLQFSNMSESAYNDLIINYSIDEMDGFLNYEQWLDLYNGEREETKAKITFKIPEGKKSVPNILEFAKDYPSSHPTQKPVALIEKIINVFTTEGAVILDNCMGSGTTAIACMNTDRNFIGFELDKTYYEKSLKRIKEHTKQTDIFDVLEGN